MKPIRTERLILRNWEERDRELFHRINSDERVMEFFPFRRNRAEADAKLDEFREQIDRQGFGWTPAEVAASAPISSAPSPPMMTRPSCAGSAVRNSSDNLSSSLCWRLSEGLSPYDTSVSNPPSERQSFSD